MKRTVIIKDRREPDTDYEFWKTRSPEERLEAVEFLREQCYLAMGYTEPPRITRVVTVLSLLNAHAVEYVVVGSYALSFHGHPRATGDMDIWIRRTPDNAARVVKALADFGFAGLGFTSQDLLEEKVIQLGMPPVRIDLMTELDGLTPDEVWNGRAAGRFGDVPVFFIGREAFIRNKRALGRHKDLADLEALGEKV